MDNAKDIISVGFDPRKTFIYSDLKYFGNHFLMNAWEFSKLLTFKYVRHVPIFFVNTLGTDLSSVTIAKFGEPLGSMKGILSWLTFRVAANSF